MLIVSAAQMSALERATFEQLQLPPLLLMENAGRTVAALTWHLLVGAAPGPPGPFPVRLRPAAEPGPAVAPGRRRPRVVVAAGKGNNGGDGLCAARHLHNWGCAVEVALWAPSEAALTPDAEVNLAACRRLGIPIHSGQPDAAEALAGADIIIDALLGTGVKGAVRGAMAEAVAAVNRAGPPVVAVDLPSGVDSDSGRAGGDAVQARWTVTLGFPKRGLFQYPGAGLAGELWVADIGVPAALAARVAGAAGGAPGAVPGGFWQALTPAVAAGLLPGFAPDIHKGSRGQVLVVGGSEAMPGAVVLAARSALRAGAGLVYAAVPETAGSVVAAQLAEVITYRMPAAGGLFAAAAAPGILGLAAGVRAMAIGPGLGRSAAAAGVIEALVEGLPCPAVLDADGLRVFTGRPGDLRRASAPLVLTPHAGEAAALLGSDARTVQADRAGALAALVERTGQTVVLKGAFTLIGAPDGTVRVNLTGNRALATAGSGDVLTGTVAALLARGLPPPIAAALGAMIHGLAGDRAAARHGCDGVLAGDVADALPAALTELQAWEDGSR